MYTSMFITNTNKVKVQVQAEISAVYLFSERSEQHLLVSIFKAKTQNAKTIDSFNNIRRK